MKNFENEFYANQHEIASRNYLNAIGDEFDAIGEDFNAFGDDNFGATQGTRTRTASLPYIIKLVNGTTADITNVPIFFANKYARISGGIVKAGVTFTVTNFDSYDTFLMQTMYKKFTIGKTYWTSSSSTQVTDITFTVINQDGDGRSSNTPIVPTLNKFANQNTVNDSSVPYVIDGNAEVRLSTLYASATLTIHFYPSETVNDKKELAGKNPTTRYGNPYQDGMLIER